MLDNSAKEYLKAFNQMPAMQEMEPEAVRNMMAEAPPVEVELAPLANVKDQRIPVRDAEIDVRIYTPEGEGPFPIFVYYHGGGWVIGDLDTADASLRQVANRTGFVVVSVDYRLSPENKFPVPLHDAYDALLWVKNHADEFRGDLQKVIVSGDSAGGNLATAVTMLDQEKGHNLIDAQVLVYPVTDLSYSTSSYEQFQEGYGLDKELMIWFGNHYIRDAKDSKNPYVAPLLAKDVSSLPPALIVTAGHDVLRDEGEAYAEKLKEAGVRTKLIREEGMIHGYFTNMAAFPTEIKRTVDAIDHFLKSV
jgi:acetyl esterase